MHIVELIHEGK